MGRIRLVRIATSVAAGTFLQGLLTRRALSGRPVAQAGARRAHGGRKTQPGCVCCSAMLFTQILVAYLRRHEEAAEIERLES
jgi:hypothetical protein